MTYGLCPGVGPP